MSKGSGGAQTIETKKKLGKLEGQNLMCNYNKKPRFWTEEERVLAAEAAERQRLQAKTPF